MDRRDALKALVSLPAVARISVAELKPEDVLVVECDNLLCEADAERIKQTMETIWPGRKVAVFSEGMKLKIVPGSQVPTT